jgi:hypothetical protein
VSRGIGAVVRHVHASPSTRAARFGAFDHFEHAGIFVLGELVARDPGVAAVVTASKDNLRATPEVFLTTTKKNCPQKGDLS